MAHRTTVAVLATLDTKGAQASFVSSALRAEGVVPLVIDAGVFPAPAAGLADVGNEAVAAAGGVELTRVQRFPSRHLAVEAMGKGAAAVLGERLRAGELDGVLALGGNQGAAIAAIAMRDLPFGLPKMIVTTVASGNMRPYVGCKDILTLFSVGDFTGSTNRVTEPVLRNAALSMAAMARQGRPAPRRTRAAIAVTALGNTEPAAARAIARLEAAGYEPIAFHASGASGSALEELVDAGELDAVLDLTPHELTEEVMGDGAYVPVRPGRLTAAGRRGIPQVISTGGMEYLCFGSPETVPPRYRGRRAALHNPMNPNIRLTGEELARVGEAMADRLNAARGPAAVLVPMRGWSAYGAAGGPLHDPEADAALLEALSARLDPRVALRRLDLHINDPAFADACVDALLSMLGPRPPAPRES